MPGIPISRITTKDIAILETMLSRYNGSCRHFAALLRRKVDSSAIYLRDDIPPDTVTLNSSVTYTVGTTVAGPHLVVQGEIEDLPAFAVSIHSLRGLALLGMSEGESVDVPVSDTESERLYVDRVLSQPEAEANLALRRPAGPLHASNVLPLRMRRSGRDAPDGDDPGPQAA
jgi:regulator of nucleoside diphosphate kinase